MCASESNTHLSATAQDPSACPLGPRGLSKWFLAGLLAPSCALLTACSPSIQNMGNIRSLTLASKSAPGEPHSRPSQEGSTSLLYPNFTEELGQLALNSQVGSRMAVGPSLPPDFSGPGRGPGRGPRPPIHCW